MMGADDEAGPFTLEKLAKRFDLLGRGPLLGDQVIETEDEERVGVVQNSLVEWLRKPRLVDPLKHGDGVSRDLAHEVLELHPCPEEQLERARDPLLEPQLVR